MTYILSQYTDLHQPMPVLNLQRFADAGTNVIRTTTQVNAYTGATGADSGMSSTMKEFYDTELLENARDKHYFAQFGRRQPLPRGRGKVIEWRKWNTMPNADILTEGVIPTGKTFGQTYITSGIKQYGMYVTISDQLELHAVDDVIMGATEELGASAGNTQDIAIRNVLCEGTNVMYADTTGTDGKVTATPTSRYGLSGDNNKLTPDTVNKAVTALKKMKAPTINGKYIALIHPSVTYDLRNSEYWIEAHKYARPEEMYNGEIGELHGVRFIETDTAPVFKGGNLAGSTAYLTLGAYSSSGSGSANKGEATKYQATVTDSVTDALIGRWVHAYDASASACVGTAKIVGINSASKYVFLSNDIGLTYASGDLLYPGEGTLDSDKNVQAVYATFFFGKDAYGIIDPDGAGMEMIIKSKEQAGGPLNQFSTVGYKFSGGTKILYEDRMLRVESCSSYSTSDSGNYGPLAYAT